MLINTLFIRYPERIVGNEKCVYKYVCAFVFNRERCTHITSKIELKKGNFILHPQHD